YQTFSGSLLRQGGTFLGTTNKGNPFEFPMPDGTTKDRTADICEGYHLLGLDGLIVIGGDGSMAILDKIAKAGNLNIVAIPKTIDGAGEKYKSVFGVIIGTGLGSGLSFNRQIIEGVNQVAGDWGHQPLPYPTKQEIESDFKCRVINCERPLCAEQFVSGSGFENNFNKKYNTNLKSIEIAQLEMQGDERAKTEFDIYEDRLSRLISIMIGIFDPEAIILGGGMSNVGRLYKNIPQLLTKYTFSDKIRNKVLKNKHGDSSGVRGAAWLWN
ncbi:ROK family protein, partial [Alphaproteobacteria bacterium]|nr:ROK family protein [Alphaproteobacteria bacterium]